MAAPASVPQQSAWHERFHLTLPVKVPEEIYSWIDEIQQAMEKAQRWISNPAALGLDIAINYSDELIHELQGFLTDSTENRKMIGPLIGQIKGIQNRIYKIELAHWVEFNGGRLSIGHRPSAKLLGDIKLQGGSHILSLLSEHEGARVIEKLVIREGLCWLWFPMSSAAPPHEDSISALKAVFAELSFALENHGSVYVHCSAGIHRTGMITYGFLRYKGLSAEEARILLSHLRDLTYEEIGEDRLSWGDRFGSIGNI